MVPPKPTYLQRLQKVLSELARDNEDTIAYETVLARVCLADSGLRRRAIVRRALCHEARARRIKRVNGPDNEEVRLTAAGVEYYRAWGIHPVYAVGDVRLSRMSIDQIYQRKSAIYSILVDIQSVFYELRPHIDTVHILENLSDAVQQAITSLEELENANSEMQQELNGEEQRRRELRAQMLRDS